MSKLVRRPRTRANRLGLRRIQQQLVCTWRPLWNAVWAINRGVLGWLHTFDAHHGSLSALRDWIGVWWRKRGHRRAIVSAEHQWNLPDRWRP